MVDPEERVVSYRLDQIDRRLDEMQRHMDDRLDRVQLSITSLAFVHKDVYASDQAALKEKVDRASSLAIKAIGFSVTITLGVVGFFIAILQSIR